MSSSNNSSGGTSFGTVLFLIFLVLKLTGVISWSWWWVTAPIWIGLIIALVIIAGIIIYKIVESKKYNTKNKNKFDDLVQQMNDHKNKMCK